MASMAHMPTKSLAKNIMVYMKMQRIRYSVLDIVI